MTTRGHPYTIFKREEKQKDGAVPSLEFVLFFCFFCGGWCFVRRFACLFCCCWNIAFGCCGRRRSFILCSPTLRETDTAFFGFEMANAEGHPIALLDIGIGFFE